MEAENLKPRIGSLAGRLAKPLGKDSKSVYSNRFRLMINLKKQQKIPNPTETLWQIRNSDFLRLLKRFWFFQVFTLNFWLRTSELIELTEVQWLNSSQVFFTWVACYFALKELQALKSNAISDIAPVIGAWQFNRTVGWQWKVKKRKESNWRFCWRSFGEEQRTMLQERVTDYRSTVWINN